MRTLIACTGAVSLVAALVTPAGATDRPGRTVVYAGHSLNVPAGWPVIDLTARPNECVRFDRNAVYLGTPGADQRCPASLYDVTDAVLIEPNGRVTVTGDRFRSMRSRDDLPEEVPEARATVQPGVYSGQGFDACAAPSQGAMDAFLSSPYRAVGVYIGGIHRACAQPNLGASWVATQARKGWHLMPIYVGRQAPCTSFANRVDLDQGVARNQGRDAANDAADRAKALGMKAGSVLYEDMEAYNTTDGPCSGAVMSFFSGWSERLHERGYKAGVYSSAGSGISDLVRNYDNKAYRPPDHVWFAWWNTVVNADGGRFLPADRWAGRRVHQFLGGHDETHDGVTINVDSNYLEITG
ncbi:hypothetical protein GCM10029964_126300 [Kibdelosporangium lantanae]